MKIKTKADMQKTKELVIPPKSEAKYRSLPATRPTPTPQKAQVGQLRKDKLAQDSSLKDTQKREADLLRNEKLARQEAQEAAIKATHIQKKKGRDFRKKEKKQAEEKHSIKRASSTHDPKAKRSKTARREDTRKETTPSIKRSKTIKPLTKGQQVELSSIARKRKIVSSDSEYDDQIDTALDSYGRRAGRLSSHPSDQTLDIMMMNITHPSPLGG